MLLIHPEVEFGMVDLEMCVSHEPEATKVSAPVARPDSEPVEQTSLASKDSSKAPFEVNTRATFALMGITKGFFRNE